MPFPLSKEICKTVISYKYGDEDNVKIYITHLNEKDKIIVKLLIKRWRIECFHRDAKQHLGLEAYQVRRARGMQVVALAILIAYTLVILAGRSLKTLLSIKDNRGKMQISGLNSL